MQKARRTRTLAVLFVLAALAAPVAAKARPAAAGWRTISTKAPAWYDEAFHARVVAAGDRGVPLPPNVEMPASSVAFLGIRPGQLLIVHIPGGFALCTANFVFRNGADYAIGTAGHCGNVGNQVSMIFAPKGVALIGSIIKSTGDAGIGNDFALISINHSLRSLVSPAMAYWGGPKSSYSSTNTPGIIKHAGWGLGVGTGGTPRLGLGTFYDTSKYYFLGAVVNGDSGSGAETGDFRAIGNITHIFCCIDGDGVHLAAGTSIPRILQIAGLPLATCTGTVPWPLYGCPTV
jgi:hypothetical protein